MNGFALHPQLAADTALVSDWPLCRVLLMNDARFPWIILVPRRAGASELIDLPEADRIRLIGEIARAGTFLRDWSVTRGGCDKLNIGMIGNIVPQLHIHIVARRKNDPAWPYPVWGRGEPFPYSRDDLALTLASLSARCADQ